MSTTDATATADGTLDRVVELWRELFDEPDLRVGPDDNLFTLGASSLLAMTLVARIDREFGTALDLMAVFEDPTPARMAACVEQARAAAPLLEEGDL
ncbi:acyl carrier protein [Streptacidiphilus sp. P02-A3a]|uniref:acyl carrier protein n=1 Tax=Streptacidiphilus sp. P02-A3a TaxID=2704468 RepID=UPI0015F7C2E6|nr:acyl carrier protein [Streptacidiphilus sp. P02-A3a]QMU71298.1 acyl carrier protein [Streptacidiphilus sp. P02-A3a]